MRRVLAAGALLLSVNSVSAQPSKVYAEISENKGIAFSLQRDPDKDPLVAYDVVSAWRGKPLVADCAAWKAELKGVTWCFASAANLAAFQKATTKDGNNEYLPSLGGHCALGTSWGYPGPKGDPTTARVYRNDRGQKVLVLQSHPKWVKTFNRGSREKFHRAEAAYNVLKAAGVIVENAKVPKEEARN